MPNTHTQQSILAELAKITPENGHAIVPSKVLQGTGKPQTLVDRQIVVCPGQGELLVHVVSLDAKTGVILSKSVASVLGVATPPPSKSEITSLAVPSAAAMSEPKKTKETSDAAANT